MQAKLATAGLRSEFGGAHSNHATEMSVTSFPDGSYLELIAIQAAADPKAVDAHYWTKYMKGESGPCAWAIRADDIAAEVARLKSAGTVVTNPERSGRMKPDGTKLEWETANIGTEPNGSFFPFIIRDFTDRNKRAFVSGKPTIEKYRGISRVVIAVGDLQNGINRYRKAFGLSAPVVATDAALGARVAVFEGTPVAIAAGEKKSRVADRVAKFGEGPCAFVIGTAGRGWHVQWSDLGWLGFE